jgi:superfamily II RNA helicase
MLLLSSKYQQLCKNIQYCIFDEIHCMSGEQGSDTWERTILLINCPMIGLSATVNNGEQVQQWIESVEYKRAELWQSEKVRQVCFISHHERVADLNKYLYSNRQLYPIHPIGMISAKQMINHGLPKDFSLSPCESLQLHQAIIDNRQVNLTQHFAPDWIVERGQCNEYSRHVCEQFKQIINDEDMQKLDSISKLLHPIKSNTIEYPEIKPMRKLIVEFVETLQAKNLLPCIVFTNSRPLCEELAEILTQYFEELENELRRTTYKEQIENIKQRLILIEKNEKKKKNEKPTKDYKNRNDEDGDRQREAEDMDQTKLRLADYEQNLLNGILDECTLANRSITDRDLVDQLLKRATGASAANPRLARYLKRGIAYHHPRLNNKGRLAVEGLFRNRHVQILFSTWTLGMYLDLINGIICSSQQRDILFCHICTLDFISIPCHKNCCEICLTKFLFSCESFSIYISEMREA